MVKIKRKKDCFGKIIVADFKKLDPALFPNIDFSSEVEKRIALISLDGRLFINSRNKEGKFLEEIFNCLILESREALLEFEKFFKNKFPDIKTFDDWIDFRGDDIDRTYALTMLLIPTEIVRRKIEYQYYG